MKKNIEVAGPVIVNEGKVLLILDGDGYWKFCGGRVEPDESWIDCVHREAKEEVDIELVILSKPFIMSKPGTNIILIHYLAVTTDKPQAKEEGLRVEWLDINNLPENLAPNILPVLRHFKFL